MFNSLPNNEGSTIIKTWKGSRLISENCAVVRGIRRIVLKPGRERGPTRRANRDDARKALQRTHCVALNRDAPDAEHAGDRHDNEC